MVALVHIISNVEISFVFILNKDLKIKMQSEYKLDLTKFPS